MGQVKKRFSHAVHIDDRRPYAQGEIDRFALGFASAPPECDQLPGSSKGCGWPGGSASGESGKRTLCKSMKGTRSRYEGDFFPRCVLSYGKIGTHGPE
jgi:hypothetical protein